MRFRFFKVNFPYTNSSIKGTIGYIIVFNHSQGHIKEPVTFWMILLQGVGTCVSEKQYFEASYAFKHDLQLKKWSKSGKYWLLGGTSTPIRNKKWLISAKLIFWCFWNQFFPCKVIWLTQSKPFDWIYLMWSCGG